MSNEDTLILYLSLSSSPSTPRIQIEISKTKTSLTELRNLVSTKSKIPLSALKLIYRGVLLKSDTDCVVSTYSLENDCVLHCMGKPDVNSVSNAATVNSGSAVLGSTMIATATPPLVANIPSGNSLASAIALLKTSSDPKTAINTLLKIISNITSHPMEEKYRTIKSTNAAFQKKVGGVPGGKECMKAMGFELVNEEYKLNATPEAWTKLVQCKNTFEHELKVLTPPQPMQQPNQTPFPSNSTSATSNMMQNLLSNPQMLQSALRNNPMMNQYLTPQQQQMLNNPAMMQQLSQFMSQNPQMLQEMQQMMEGGGSGAPGMPDMRAMQDMMRRYQTGMQQPAQQQQTNSTQQQQGDDSMTEEEMIAEAIARSLRET